MSRPQRLDLSLDVPEAAERDFPTVRRNADVIRLC
jgi:hypothetical protein